MVAARHSRIWQCGTDEDGQQVVEFALALPAVILALLVVFNTLMFASECARFDRVANEVMRSAVTVPTPELQSQIKSRLDRGMGYPRSSRFSISVDPPSRVIDTGGFFFDHLRLECHLNYEPWPAPRSFGFSEVGAGANVNLGTMSHPKSLVIDHYMPAGIF